jgi:hypothetical protein
MSDFEYPSGASDYDLFGSATAGSSVTDITPASMPSVPVVSSPPAVSQPVAPAPQTSNFVSFGSVVDFQKALTPLPTGKLGFDVSGLGSLSPGTYSLDYAAGGLVGARPAKVGAPDTFTVNQEGMAILDKSLFPAPAGPTNRQLDSIDLEKRINAVETSSRNELIGTVGVAVLGGAIQYLLAVRNEKSQMKLWEKQYDAQLEMLALQTEAYENERGGGGGGGGGARASITRGIYGGKS